MGRFGRDMRKPSEAREVVVEVLAIVFIPECVAKGSRL